MNFPWPISTFRDFTKRQQLLRGALRDMKGKSDALSQVQMALKRAIRGPTLAERQALNAIERRRGDLTRQTGTIDLLGKQVSLADHGVACSAPRPWTDILFQLARVIQPNAALELGTNVGMSGSAMASALRINGKGHLWTIEGVPDLAKAAQDTFENLGLTPWATSVTGWFKDTLEPTLTKGPFTLVLVDGNHDGDATLDYYAKIKPNLTASSIVVFDDINWSRGMQAAWKTIQEDKDIRDTCEAAGYGIVSIW